MTRKRFTAEMAIQAACDSHGIVSAIAQRMGCDRRTVYRLMKKYPTVADAVDDAREKTKDLAESRLFEQINRGNMTAIIFYAKTQMKDRGYIEKQIVAIEGWNEFEQLASQHGMDAKALLQQMKDILRDSE